MILGNTIVSICDGYTEVALPNGKIVTALHVEQDGQAETAAYIGCSVELMNRTHDALHALLAHMIGLSYSPTLGDVANGFPATELHGMEEDAVLAIQRFAHAMGRLQYIGAAS